MKERFLELFWVLIVQIFSRQVKYQVYEEISKLARIRGLVDECKNKR